MTYPLQDPVGLPVAGHGCNRMNVLFADSLLWILPLLSRGQVKHFALFGCDFAIVFLFVAELEVLFVFT